MKDKKFPYRCGKVKPASVKKIEKVKNKSLSSFKVGLAYFTICIFPLGFITLLKFCITVINKFFLIQYLRKIKIIKTPIKNVDHELDTKIPFIPEQIGIYLDFINFWIRPISMIIKRFGMIQGVKIEIEFLRYIRFTYLEAFSIYKVNMTTTNRPKCATNKAARRMQKADPHYLCVPSLHIAVICLTYSFYATIFERENFTTEEKERWLPELADHGIKIAESVLYMKQHSVNCIPAAIHMMTNIIPELFTVNTALKSIERLFKDSKDISEEDKKKIRDHITFTYEKFFLVAASTKNWRESIFQWMKDYNPYIPS